MLFFILCILLLLILFFLRKKKYKPENNEIPQEKEEVFEEKSEKVESLPVLKNVDKKPEDFLKELQKQKEEREKENAHYDIIVIDIETTSYEWQYADRNDILQVSIIDRSGNVLLNQYCAPRKKKEWVRAFEINSISTDTVKGCPYFKDVKPYVQDIFGRSKRIMCFDYHLLHEYLERYKFDLSVINLFSPVYDLRRYNLAHNIENPKWTTVEDAASELGIADKYNLNNSLDDAMATLEIYEFLEGEKKKLKDEIRRNHIGSEVKNKYQQNVNADKSNYFYGKKIAFVDDLPISREEAYKKVSDCGAITRVTVGKTLDILVCGERSAMRAYEYGKISGDQKKAEKLNSEGAKIEIMSAQRFMELLDQSAGEP